MDGSAESAGALKSTADYCARTSARGGAVIAWHFPAAAGPAPTGHAPKPVTTEAEQQMSETLAITIAEVAPGTVLDQRIGYGHPAQVLVEQSADAGLVVVGSRGHGAFTGMLVGSVSMHVVTHARYPVVVVRSDN